MQCLQVELVLRLLWHAFEVRAQYRLGNRFGIVVVVLLPLVERLGVLGRDDARFKAKFAQRAADKMGTQARFQADDTPR